MMNVILAIHIIACLLLTGFVLIQKSEGGGLGLGGGGGGGNALLSGRGAAGAIVRMTMIVGGIFFLTSLALTAIVARSSDAPSAVDAVLESEASDESGATGLDFDDPTAVFGDTVPETTVEAPEIAEPVDAPLDASAAESAVTEEETGESTEPQ